MFASLTQGLGACDEQARMIQSAANERWRTHALSIGHGRCKVNVWTGPCSTPGVRSRYVDGQ